MNTDQSGFTGRGGSPDSHYHNGSWYSDYECRCAMSTRSEAALRWYSEALLTGTTEEVLAADAEVDAAIKEKTMSSTNARSEITHHEPHQTGHGSSRTWQRTILGKQYSFNAVLMPNGERRYFAHQLEPGKDDLAARFACYWHPVISWIIKEENNV